MLPCAVDWAFCSNVCHQLRLVHCLEPIQRNVPQQTTVGCWMDLIRSLFYTPTISKEVKAAGPRKNRETFTKSYNTWWMASSTQQTRTPWVCCVKLNLKSINPKSKKTSISKNQRESDFLCEDLILRLQPLSTHQCAGHHEQYERPISRSWGSSWVVFFMLHG